MIAPQGFTQEAQYLLRAGDLFTVQTEIAEGEDIPKAGETMLITPRPPQPSMPGRAFAHLLAVGMMMEKKDCNGQPISRLVELKMRFIAHLPL